MSENIFKKDMSFVFLSSNLNLFQRKVINIFIYNAQINKAPKNTDFFISINKLKDQAGFAQNDRNNTYIKNKIQELTTTSFHSNISLEKKEQIFKNLSCTNAIVKYAFTEKFFELSQNSKNAIELNLDIIKNYNQKYSLALYEILKFISSKKGTKLSMKFLRWYFALEKDQYKAAGDLKKRIIDTCLEEINDFSDISVDYIPLKNGKKIYGYDFTILPSNKLDKNTQIQKNIEKINIINKFYKNTQFYSTKHQGFFYFKNIDLIENGLELKATDESFTANAFYFKDMQELCKFLKERIML